MSHESNKKSVVVVGGGTGTHTVLRGLKKYRKRIDLTAIVTMADSGGSTGRLRDEFGYLPVGDVRMALAALASDVGEHEELLRELFLYRFDKGEGLSGHNFGNLLLVALTDILGSEEAAIRAAARVLRVRGEVIPVTTEPVHLVAEYEDGRRVVGEHDIDEPLREHLVQFGESRIARLSVEPAASINPRAEEALLNADVIVLGPGDLYTSTLANCVVDGVDDAIRHSGAKLVYVANLMTRAGQTTGMGVVEHVDEISSYVGKLPDVVLANTGEVPEDLLERYRADGEYPVAVNVSEPAYQLITEDFLAKEEVKKSSGDVLRRSLVRHDIRTLARAIMDVV